MDNMNTVMDRMAQMPLVITTADLNPITAKSFRLPDVKLPSKMAFQVIYKLEQDGADITVDELKPYPGKPALFQSRKHFPETATRPRLDFVTKTSYGFIKFECLGEESKTRMLELIEKHEELGWTSDPGTDQEQRFRPVYADINNNECSMLLINVKETFTALDGMVRKVTCLGEMGIAVSSDPKAAKRVRRSFSNAIRSVRGHVTDKWVVREGTVYEIMLEDTSLITMLDVNMDLMDPRARAFFDGSAVIKLPGFNGCILTVDGPFGQAKGIAYDVETMNLHQIYCYGIKEEIIDTRGRVFIANVSYVGLGSLWTDMQTITNIGGYEMDLVVKYGLDALNKYARILLDGTQDEVCDLFAAQALADEEAYNKRGGAKPRWGTMQALKYDIGFDRLPMIFERLFKTGFENLIKIDRCRVPIEQGIRAYARWNPLCGTDSGLPDFTKDELGGTVCVIETQQELPIVCVPDAPEGRLLIGRNPNTHPGEFILVWNVHIRALMKFRGKGWVFFGANAGELLSKLNGGDMDDGLMVIWDNGLIEKWLTMEYPVQPKINQPKSRAINDARAARRRRLTGIGDEWNWDIFDDQKKKWTEFSQSLGGFIIKLWVEMLLSGEHKDSILESLKDGAFLVPDNFTAPVAEELKDKCLPKDMADLARDYTETEEGFLAVCTRYITDKANYRGARAASNSELIIDWDVMRKGDEATVRMLFGEAAELMRTPVFPMCFKDRIPAKRVAAGDYILVETKLCKAMKLLVDRYNEILEEMKEVKKLNVLELPTQLVEAYPVDERTAEDAELARTWWLRNLRRMREEGRMDREGRKLNSWYSDLADGEKRVIEHKKQITCTAASGRKYVREVLDHVEVERNPGLVDLYAFQFEPSEDQETLVCTGRRRSVENRRAMAIYWLNELVYKQGRDSDGIPDFMLLDLFNAMKELGLTGRRVFVSFNPDGRKYAERLKDGEQMDVNVVKGILYHPRNGKQLTDDADMHLPDGEAKVSKAGVILVTPCHSELAAGRKAEVRAVAAKGRFIE